MKALIYSIMMLLLLGCVAPLVAQEEGEDDAQPTPAKKVKKERPEQRPVPKALKKVKTYNGKPNMKADYYIYLQSASWCTFCEKEMPEIAEQYPEMKKANVELVLLSRDTSSDVSKAWLKKHKAKFPFAMNTEKDKEIKLPGFSHASGIPHATFVDAKGNVLQTGHGALVKNWRQVLSAFTMQERDEEEE